MPYPDVRSLASQNLLRAATCVWALRVPNLPAVNAGYETAVELPRQRDSSDPDAEGVRELLC